MPAAREPAWFHPMRRIWSSRPRKRLSEMRKSRESALSFHTPLLRLETAVANGESDRAITSFSPAKKATSVLRKVNPSKMWWWVAITSNSLWLPAPSKIASPSPAALMAMASRRALQGKRPEH